MKSCPTKIEYDFNKQMDQLTLNDVLLFSQYVQAMMQCCEKTCSQMDKLVVITELFKELNRTFPLIMQYQRDATNTKWRKLARAIYNKTLEFETEQQNGRIKVTDEVIIKPWMEELAKTKVIVAPYLYKEE